MAMAKRKRLCPSCGRPYFDEEMPANRKMDQKMSINAEP
jgi:hypothetical protein